MLLLGRSCSISFGNKLSSHTLNLPQTELPEGRATIKFKTENSHRREFLLIFVLAEPSAEPEQIHCVLNVAFNLPFFSKKFYKHHTRKNGHFQWYRVLCTSSDISFFICSFYFSLYFVWGHCEHEISVWLIECKMSYRFCCRLKIKGHVKLKCYSFNLALSLNAEISTFFNPHIYD